MARRYYIYVDKLPDTIMLATTQINTMTERKNKRLDPNYTKITVDVKKEIAAKTRAICAFSEITISEAMEEALNLWIAAKKKDGSFEI